MIGISAIVGLILLLAIVVGGTLAGTPAAINNSSTCSTWSSADQTQQHAYAQRYLRTHGSLPGGGKIPADVVTAVNTGCTRAFDNDTQDTITVVQAIQQQ
jgi:hypothetical protein